MIRTELSLVVVLLSGFGLWIAGMFAVSLSRSLAWQKQQRISAGILPPIREALVDYLSGSEERTRLQSLVRANPEIAGNAVMSFEGAVAGNARDRLCEISLELALVHRWCEDTRSRSILQRRTAFHRLSFVCSFEPCRRLAGDILHRALRDPDDEVKLSASRALVYSGGIDDVERVFEYAVSQGPLVRILVGEELRRHSALLCERAIPKVLQSGDPERVLAMLQVVAAWERALPMQGIAALLKSGDRRIRLLTLKIAAMVPDSAELHKGIVDAISDSDAEVAAFAARTAGRLRLETALPVLARVLRTGHTDLARAAAFALGDLPPRGWVTLQELSSSPNSVTAQAASEALARATGQV
jgi:HEAT repeat protein